MWNSTIKYIKRFVQPNKSPIDWICSPCGNWLYFSKQLIEVDDINFLTGKNGAGKSTVIDAFQIVLLGETNARNFNQAANEKSQRTLDGYLRADMDDNNPHSRRGKDFSSYIACEFWDDVEGTRFVTGVVFDCHSDGSRQDRFFIYDGEIPETCFIEKGEAIDRWQQQSFKRSLLSEQQKLLAQLQKDVLEIKREAIRMCDLCRTVFVWQPDELLTDVLDAANAVEKAYALFTDCDYEVFSKSIAIFEQAQFGTDKYQFRVDRNPDYADYYDMIMAPELMEGDTGLFALPFQQKYGNLIESLFSQIALSDDTQVNARKQSELQQNIQRFTDFRTYLKFDLETTDQNGSRQLLSQTLNTKSGGETQTPFYIAVLASFAQLYQVNNLSGLANNTVRLVVFDEAFNKMDSERIVESVRLLRKMGLQALICTPPDKLPDIMPLADRTLLVSKEKYQMHVLSYGKEMART